MTASIIEQTKIMAHNYASPVNQLLTFGDLRMGKQFDYGGLGLDPEHAPELLRMVFDEELNTADPDSDEVWALGRLRAESAVEPLLRLFEYEDDYMPFEAETALAEIGPVAIPAVKATLQDRARSIRARLSAAASLGKLGERHPDQRAECVAILSHQLTQAAAEDPDLNGALVTALLDLKAVEAAPVIESAFSGRHVALEIAGDWEDVQVELGLLEKRMTPRPNYVLQSLQRSVRAAQKRQREAERKAKARRKQEKKSRKQAMKRKK